MNAVLVGGITGSMLSGWAGNLLGDNIILVAAVLLIPIFPVIAYLERGRSSRVIEGICPQGSKSVRTVFTEGVSTVFSSRYLLGIVAVVGLYEIVSTIIDYQFTAALSEAFSSRHLTAGWTRAISVATP